MSWTPKLVNKQWNQNVDSAALLVREIQMNVVVRERTYRIEEIIVIDARRRRPLATLPLGAPISYTDITGRVHAKVFELSTQNCRVI